MKASQQQKALSVLDIDIPALVFKCFLLLHLLALMSPEAGLKEVSKDFARA